MAILSFANLKKTKPNSAPIKDEEKQKTSMTPSSSWTPFTESDSLINSNFCEGCKRFDRDRPEDKQPSAMGYGWCERTERFWRPIPASATVARCTFEARKKKMMAAGRMVADERGATRGEVAK